MQHLTPARIIDNPGPEFGEERRFWQGCPTILRSAGGRLYAGWYSGGSREPSPFNYNLLVRSDDGGATWSEPLLVIGSLPEQHIRSIDIQLWMAPDGVAWLFWVQRWDGCETASDPRHLSTWAITSRNLDDDRPLWSKPRCISPGFLRCQPTALRDGRYLLFAYDWTCDRYAYSESSDQGKSWRRRLGGKKVPTPFDETMAVELKDGLIRMLARCTGGFLAESYSYDGGKSWTDGALSNLTSTSTRFFFARLKSGALLLVRNDHPAERTNLGAYLSTDEGKSWQGPLPIDGRNHVSYPDAVEGEGGEIYLLHDCCRLGKKEILFSRFTERDIRAGEPVSPGSFIARVISKPPAEPCDPAAYEETLRREKEYRCL